MVEQLTPEEARTVKLSWNPIKRLGQLARYEAAYKPVGLVKVGWGSEHQVFTRGALVRAAEMHERVEAAVAMLEEIDQRSQEEKEN